MAQTLELRKALTLGTDLNAGHSWEQKQNHEDSKVESWRSSAVQIDSSQMIYNELDAIPVKSVDVLEQLEKNMQMLSQLRSRLQFLNREIRYLMKI